MSVYHEYTECIMPGCVISGVNRMCYVQLFTKLILGGCLIIPTCLLKTYFVMVLYLPDKSSVLKMCCHA